MSEKEPTVFVVDDDAAARLSIENLLHSVGLRFQAFSSPVEFLKWTLPDAPCCLVLDVRLPQMSGLEVQRHLTARGTSLPIVFITGHGDIPMSVEAMKGGAMEFLTKPFRGQVLLDAIHKAIEKDRSVREAKDQSSALQGRMASLSPREREVLHGVVSGKLNKEIAGELGTSERTIKVHRANLMRKMGASSLADLIRMAAGAAS